MTRCVGTAFYPEVSSEQLMASNSPSLSVSFISTVFSKPVFKKLPAAGSPAASSSTE